MFSEFRDCFLLFAKGKNIMNPEELTIIMRSLGFSPTAVEIDKYFEQNAKGIIITRNLIAFQIHLYEL